MRTPWDFWRSLGSPRWVAAPMVDQSELAFRMLCRELGTGLCYTPMLHARLMTEVQTYRNQHVDTGLEVDRPLFGQLAGHDPQVVLSAARLIEHSVDAVDLNFGCPQNIAKKGRRLCRHPCPRTPTAQHACRRRGCGSRLPGRPPATDRPAGTLPPASA